MAATADTVFGPFADAYQMSLCAEFPPLCCIVRPSARTAVCRCKLEQALPDEGEDPSGMVRASRICPCPSQKTLPGTQVREYKSSENRLPVCTSSGGAFSDPN